MSKRKHKHKFHFAPPANSSAAFKQNGLKAFRRSDFNAAIDQWSRLDVTAEPAVRSALAEAHFRRALSVRDSALGLTDLARSVELMPGEGCYWYHLGLAHHRADRIDEAIAAYARAAETGFALNRLGFARGLAEVERNPHVDLESLDGVSPADRAALSPIAALLRHDPQAALDAQTDNGSDRPTALVAGSASNPASMLWRGLALLATGQTTQALAALAPSGQPLKAGAEAVRAYYHGVALAAAGDPDGALAEWTAAAARTLKCLPVTTPRLQASVANAHLRRVRAAIETREWQTALTSVEAGLKAAPGHPALTAIRLVARNRLAQDCAARGEWAGAILHWQHMCTGLESHPDPGTHFSVGPITPILHNLAIAQERIEQWEAAAEAWSALLNKLPRRPTKKSPAGLYGRLPIPEFRAWLRRRALDCYRRAGRPDQAIAHYRNAVKANPDDLDLRLELADALIANDQIIAGRNELQRILQKDPAHAEAHIRLAEVHQQRGELYAAEQQLRATLETDPQHAPARRGLVEILGGRGHAQFNVGYFAQAKKIYEEALLLAPDDAQLLVWLGNTELALHQVTAARERFEAAMAASRGDLHTYVHVFGCWARRGNLSEARRILDRAEAAGVASPHFYVDVAGECFQNARHASPPAGFPSAKKLGDDPWERLGWELLQKAESAGSDSAESLRHVVAILGPVKPDLALEYAQKLVRRTPNDPGALLQLGVLQGMNGQTQAAKDSLRRAASLARKQDNSELLDEIQQARHLVANPLMAMLSRMELPFDEFEDEDLF